MSGGEATITSVLLSLGLPGVVILGLAATVRILHKRLHEIIDKRHDDLKELHKLYHEALSENTRTTEALVRAWSERGPR